MESAYLAWRWVGGGVRGSEVQGHPGICRLPENSPSPQIHPASGSDRPGSSLLWWEKLLFAAVGGENIAESKRRVLSPEPRSCIYSPTTKAPGKSGERGQEECKSWRMGRSAVKSCLLDSLAIVNPQQLWSPAQDLQKPRVDLWPRPSLRIYQQWIFARGDLFCLENVGL